MSLFFEVKRFCLDILHENSKFSQLSKNVGHNKVYIVYLGDITVQSRVKKLRLTMLRLTTIMLTNKSRKMHFLSLISKKTMAMDR